MVIDPTLKTALDQSPALTEEMRQKFLAAAEKGLTPEQLAQALLAIKQTGEKYAAMKTAYDAKKAEIDKKYLEDLKRVVPNVMVKIEEKERAIEDVSSEKLLNNL